MQHSVKFISKSNSELSDRRKDKKRFSYEGFIQYAKDNMDKYSIIDTGHDMLVSTWYSSDLINDYQKTL